MPETAKRLKVRDLLDPRDNIFGGVRLLRALANEFHGDLTLTIAAYNAGDGAVLRYAGVPPYQQTRDYVTAVTTYYRRYGAIAEWREQRRDDVQTRDAIVGYLADVHRTASKTLGVGTKLECCRVDDALTEATAADALSMALSVALSAVASCPPAATEKRGWGDSTDALARFHAELTLVDEVARSLARRVPTFVATFDDLRALGLEGLLDAARRFDPARGVPFAQWARVRVRSTILNGVRCAGRPRNATAVAIVHADPTPAVSPETELGEAEERALLLRATSSLPTPVSPITSTGALDRATASIAVRSVCMAGPSPTSSNGSSAGAST
jgi:hypothetical protein